MVKVAGVNLTASSSFKVNASMAPLSAHLDLVGVLGALQLLADVGGLIPDLNVPSALLGVGVAAALGDAAGVLTSGFALVPFGGFAKAGIGLRNGIVAASRAYGCFGEGTAVQTETRAKPIEQIEPGEKVLARSERTGQQSLRRVKSTFQTGEQTLRRVKSTFQFDSQPVYRLQSRETGGNGERDTSTVTGEHPFYLQGQG
ncbi:gll0205 [Gloeobacter violaceus PCC 7421]|uniref:Gll0205 protein n=1 Tax=Gloeobacter violaceus (strain ATCC 29082 / PCC 7421) TaxID=251221 RepID=Q7NP52_GLOVI|nr:gll0205 [Gloeobacter violaceus PCC 7421]